MQRLRMGKQQVRSVTACVFLFLSLASQIHCTSQRLFLNQAKRGIGSLGDASNFDAIRLRSLQATIGGVSQQQLKEKDLIQKLPGQPSVNFKQYGGYVPANEKVDRFLYYYFVEAVNANASTPLVVWFNGGPGCSSLRGAFSEIGPFRVHSDGKTLFTNPYSWNNEANILFLESPSGVGFSYSNTPLDAIAEGGKGDNRTAEENYMFLVNWLERFPEYKGRELYISGQSYAGHYVPQLAQLILHRSNKTLMNLRGILIGNPRLDQMKELDGIFQFMAGHGMIPQDYFDNYKKYCAGEPNDECADTIVTIVSNKRNFDVYSVYAPMCKNSTLTDKPKKGTTVMDYDPCNVHYMTAYLNIYKVQEAMHSNTTHIPYAWSSCNNDLFTNWSEENGKLSMYPILKEMMVNSVRVMVYSGDVDLVVPVTSTITSLKFMNLTVENAWSPWFGDEEDMGGFVETYKGNFTFATVRGAGHSVPTDQPIRALTLFTNFIRNTPFRIMA